MIEARAERRDDGTVRVLAPAIGWWTEHPPAGALLGAGSRVGVLLRAGRQVPMHLPADVGGRICTPLSSDRMLAVEYGQPLFDLAPLSAVAEPAGARPATGEGAGEGLLAVSSPTDGIFYRRPAPGAPPFVDVGATIEQGHPVGLIEVMKTFHQVLYGGAGLPARAVVAQVRCEDGAEVHAGEALLLVHPGTR